MKENKWITYQVPRANGARGIERAAPVVQSDNQPADAESGDPSQREHGLKRTVREGDRFQVAVRPRERADLEGEPIDFQVRYEDIELMVVDKPSGVNVHPCVPGRGTRWPTESFTIGRNRVGKEKYRRFIGWIDTPPAY